MIVYVHSHDIYDAGMSFDRHQGLRDVVHITIPTGYSLAQTMRAIIARVRNRHSIWRMIWNAHGNRGHVGLGRGIGPYNAQELTTLAPYFTHGGPGLEIQSCLVASAAHGTESADDGLGVETVRRFAYFLQVPVRGAYGLQYGQDTTLFGMVTIGDTEGRYETPWVTAYPNGAVSEHDASQVPW